MVINVGESRAGHADYVQQAIHAAVDAAGADFVKTSTGFAPSCATLEELRLMRAGVSLRMQVKASGGVRTLDAALDVIEVGVTRVRATATAANLGELAQRQRH